MAEAPREAWITGIGIVSCLGEGLDAHWQGFADGKRVIDSETFAPFIVHPLAPIDFDKQMIVGAGGGTQPAGARVEITGLSLADGRLTVKWKLHQIKKKIAARIAAGRKS